MMERKLTIAEIILKRKARHRAGLQVEALVHFRPR
jgi:hypothetical protein